MNKIKIIAIALVLLLTLVIPASAATNLTLFTWVHTSDGLDSVVPGTFPDTYDFAFSPNYAADNTVYAANVRWGL